MCLRHDLKGDFLARSQDVAWLYRYGASEVFPDAWSDFTALVSAHERHDLIGAYGSMLHGHDSALVDRAAKAWSLWEAKVSTLEINPGLESHFLDQNYSRVLARIEQHYFANDCFIQENQLLDRAEVLADIPLDIVHGRYDMCCALRGAWDLKQALPHAQLHIVQAGHSLAEPEIRKALLACTHRYIDLL